MAQPSGPCTVVRDSEIADTSPMEPRWRLTVEESFSISGRGSVVVGPLTGTANQGEAALVTTPSGQSFSVDNISIDIPRKAPHDPSRGIRVSILLAGIDKRLLVPGTVVQSIDR